MAEMVLLPGELVPGGLPDRCVVCGAAGCTPVKREFRVSVGESNYAVLTVHQLRVREGWLPLCPLHAQHFLSPLYAVAVGAGIIAAAIVLATVIGSIGTRVMPSSSAPGFAALIVFLAGVVGAVIAARSIKEGAVQESDVTDEGVRLKNLDEGFAAAVRSAREQAAGGS